MATLRWIGGATAVAQVWTGSIDTVDGTPANNTFTVTIGNVAVSVAGDTNVNTTATNLRTALNASTHPYFSTITWSGSTGNIVGTADTAGVPFVAALTVSGGGTGTVTDFSETTANAGPNVFGTAANWDSQTAPTNNDICIFKDNAVDCVYGLAQTGVTLYGLQIFDTYTGQIGLREGQFATDVDADTFNASYLEYRQSYLAIKVDGSQGPVEIHKPAGLTGQTGSSRIKLDLSTTAATVLVYDTSSSTAETGLPPVRLKANSSSTDIFVLKASGGLGIANDDTGETTTIRKVSISDQTTASKVQTGEGVTITTWEQNGGVNKLVLGAATCTTVTVRGGQLTIEGDQVVTTTNVHGGTVYPNQTGTAGTVNLYGGTTDTLGSNQARTWTTTNMFAGATLKMDRAVLTMTTLNCRGTITAN